MSYGVFSPAVPETSKDILLGEGIVYKNYGEAGEAVIGATISGSKLEIARNIMEMKYDGAYGKTKGLRRVERIDAKLSINFLKISYVNLAYGIPTTVSDGSDADGTYKKINFDLEIADTDVLTNVAFVGQKHDGTACIIYLQNAVCIDKIDLDFKPKGSLSAEINYQGFYLYSAPTVPPVSIYDYV